jgi:hypothetical protein
MHRVGNFPPVAPWPARAGVSAALFAAVAALSGCAAMLPHSRTVTESPWQSFKEVQGVFDQIEPYKTTTEDLKDLNLDPTSNPNIAILNYSDVLRRFVPSPSVDAKSIDVAVMECIEAKTVCRGYEIDQRYMKRMRNGAFWADFLNFKRKTDIEGWRFTGVILIKGDKVIYKLTGGQPSIREYEESTSPMGPLQGIGESKLGRFF